MTQTTQAIRSSCESLSAVLRWLILIGLPSITFRLIPLPSIRCRCCYYCSARLRGVEVAPSAEAARVLAAALPRSSLTSPEAVASALSAPAGGASAMAEATRRVAAAADSVALRDTGLPVVAGFSRR